VRFYDCYNASRFATRWYNGVGDEASATPVSVAPGSNVAGIDGTLSVPAVPVVKGNTPTFGSEAGGTTVAIVGTGMTGATEVRFGDTPASFTVMSKYEVDAIAPPGTAGQTVNIVVTSPGGTSEP